MTLFHFFLHEDFDSIHEENFPKMKVKKYGQNSEPFIIGSALFW